MSAGTRSRAAETSDQAAVRRALIPMSGYGRCRPGPWECTGMESVAVRAETQERDGDTIVVVTLAGTSWTLNVRASQVTGVDYPRWRDPLAQTPGRSPRDVGGGPRCSGTCPMTLCTWTSVTKAPKQQTWDSSYPCRSCLRCMAKSPTVDEGWG
jgi:hypothetical protein